MPRSTLRCRIASSGKLAWRHLNSAAVAESCSIPGARLKPSLPEWVLLVDATDHLRLARSRSRFHTLSHSFATASNEWGTGREGPE
jgi:hypothetical protein